MAEYSLEIWSFFGSRHKEYPISSRGKICLNKNERPEHKDTSKARRAILVDPLPL
jgi:hypothetical protein